MPEPDNTCFQHVLSGVQTESEKNTKQVKKILFFHVFKSATCLRNEFAHPDRNSQSKFL